MDDGKKIKYNLLIGVLSQGIILLLGIIVPKLVLTQYGSEVNGLLSSITNIYAYIAIVEAGVAAASCQALYTKIAENNRDGISAILSATNRYYHKTGLIYLVLVLAFSFVYPMLIETEISYKTIVLIIIFNGLGNVINYFFHGKYLILLKADGKNYIRTGLDLFSNSAKQLSKIILISLGCNVVFVQFVSMILSVVQMIYITVYIKKNYSWLDLNTKPDYNAISQSPNVFVHEVNYLITSNTDTVLLTAFSTLKTVSVYSLYNLLFTIMNRILRVIRDSLEFKVAHVFNKDKKAFVDLFEMFEVCYITLAFALFSVMDYFIIPFIRLYTEGVTDVNYIHNMLPFYFLLINLLSVGRYPSDAMIHIAGHFKLTQKSAIAESVINVVASLLLVQRYEIVGVLLGTIISSLYRTNYLIRYVNKHIVGRSTKSTYKCWGINFTVFIFLSWIKQFVVVNLDSYLRIFAFCVPYAVSVFALYYLILFLFEPRIHVQIITIVKSHLRKKRKS